MAEKVEEGDGEKPGQGVGEAVEAGLGSLAQAAQKRIKKKIEFFDSYFVDSGENKMSEFVNDDKNR